MWKCGNYVYKLFLSTSKKMYKFEPSKLSVHEKLFIIHFDDDWYDIL